MLTRIIPRAVLIVIFVFMVSEHLETQTNHSSLQRILSSSTVLVIYLGAGSVAGEIVQLIRNKIHPVLLLFRRLLFEQNDNKKFLLFYDRVHLFVWDILSSGLTGKIAVPIAERSPLSIFQITSNTETNAQMGLWNDFKNNFDLDGKSDGVIDIYG